MATVSSWTPFGVALDITATGSTVTRKSATQYTVKINVSWVTHYSGAKTNYGMTATSGGSSATINTFGTKASSGSGTITGTYSISGNSSATKTITVTFKNFNTDNGDSATKNVSFSVTVPAWTSYTVSYNANGGSGAPSSQTKWKDQSLTLSSTKPTRTGYTFQGWGTSSSATTVSYAAGASYTSNASITLYAVWKAITYTVSYNANGGSSAPSNQTKTYGVDLTLTSTKPTRTNYNFKGWGTSSSATTVSYAAGASYTKNASITLYAIWELAYTAPRITNFTVNRCDVDGNLKSDGTYALVDFSWECDKTVSSILIEWKLSTDTEYSSNFEVTVEEGTSGTVSQTIGDGMFADASSYTIQVTVEDTVDKTVKIKTLNSLAFTIHGRAGGNGVAFGKTSELEGVADFLYELLLRANAVFKNDKSVIGESVDGLESYSALIPMTESGNVALGHGLYKAAKGHTNIYGNDVQFYTNNGIYTNGNKVVMNNDISIVGVKPDGTEVRCFSAQSSSGNTVIGYDNYANKNGNTHLYGYDLLHFVSNIATPGSYRPYRRRGDSITLTFHGSGYITNAKKELWFWIPFSVPIVGSPTVTIASGDGFCLRQNELYTHGSSATVYTKPDSYTAILSMFHGVIVKATFSTVTNAVNNSPIGIRWNGTITFS